MKAQRGFTLIEVLLATALLAAGLALAFATLRAATATATRGEAMAQRNERIRAAESFLRARLSSARAVVFDVDRESGLARRFRGDGERIEFVADLPDYLGRGGPCLHRVQVERAPDGTLRMLVSFHVVQGGAVVESDTDPPPEVLADRLRSVQVRYRGLKPDGHAGEWLPRWDAADAMPLQVELRIRDADGIEWPPLLVALPLAGRFALQAGVP
jgi:general secretion pathway protein J